MRYQIQKYNLGDYTKREVVAQSDDLIEENVVTQWVSSNTPSPVAGFGFATVADNHDWYVAPVTPVVETEKIEQVKAPLLLEGDCAPFTEVAKYELERSRLERIARSKQE